MKHQSAFTLIEVLTALAIISILSMIAIPNLQAFLQRSQDTALRADLLRLLETAHTEAQIKRKTITICGSRNQQFCTGDWSTGYMMFVDPTRDGILHDSSQIIAVQKFKTVRGTLHLRFYPHYREYIQMNPLMSEHKDNGTIWYCRQRSILPVWGITFNGMGRNRVLSPDENGEIKDSHSRVLSC
jgi:type IV fimbrial biogenesis protein FimT